MIIEAGKYYRMQNGSVARFYATDGLAPYVAHGAYFNEYDYDFPGWNSGVWTINGECRGPKRYNIVNEIKIQDVLEHMAKITKRVKGYEK